MEFKSFQARFNLSDEDFRNFEQDINNILEEKDMWVDDSDQEQYELEMNDQYSIDNANRKSIERYYDSMTDEECPF